MLYTATLNAQSENPRVQVDWNKVDSVSRTTPTLQVVVNPQLRRGAKLHDGAFHALRELGAEDVRYVPWLPYPRLAVAELEPPADGKTSWDFSLIDPMMEDFIHATEGHPVVVNFSAMPAWLWKTDKPVEYPADPWQVAWNYTQGTELRDPSMQEAAQYYARLLAWYTQGGFTDEAGKRHESGHHYKIAVWEVLNEVDSEHRWTPESYTRFYDAVVSAMRAGAKTPVHGAGAGKRRQSEDVRVLSRSGTSPGGHAAGLHQLSLLCDASRGREPTDVAVHILESG